MALPVLVRNWQFTVNQLILNTGNTTTYPQLLLRTIKDLLCGTGSLTWTDSNGNTITPVQPWIVTSCSDGIAFGNNDNVDRWDSNSDLVWRLSGSPTNHSWIVIKQTGLPGTSFEVLIDLISTDTSRAINIICSHTGFGSSHGGANGTLATAPTALNSNTIATNMGWGCHINTSLHTRIHVMRSVDGKGTRVLSTHEGLVNSLWFFDQAGNPESGWTQPYLAFLNGANQVAALSADSVTASDISGSAVSTVRSFGASAYGGTLTCESPRNSFGPIYQTSTNSYSGNLPLFPAGFMSSAASNIGRHGVMPDFWFGLENQLSGNSYPDTGNLYQFVQVSDFVLPWNRTLPNFTGL